MKRLFVSLSVLAVMAACAGMASAQRNPRGKATLEVNGKTVSVDYGRPSLHGRTVEQMLSQLKAGQVWRLGADQSTTFSTTGDLKFGGETVPKGEYSLWARKEADNTWKLVFNKQHGQWGTEHDPKQDLVAVPLQETKASKPAEEVTIALAKAGKGGDVTIEWGGMKLATSFE